MQIGIKPTVDIVFKKIFGSTDHEDLPLHFLNELLPLAGREPVASLTILNPYLIADFEGDKEVSLDLRLEEKDKRDMQVEMQVRQRGALDNRMLTTWSKLYTSQIGRGDSYALHRPAISIWIIGAAHFGDGSWLHVFEAHCRRTGHTLSPNFLILTIELEVFRSLKQGSEWDSVGLGLRKWLTLLAEGETLDPEHLPESMADADVREALQIMSTFKLQDRERILYDSRQDYEWARNAEMAEAKQEGLKEGERAKALSDAKNFKRLGVSTAIIVEATGLSQPEVEGL
jgi:predicted transposase/invertase (TIGR01784 family)